MLPRNPRIGIWIIGARGGLATTLITGCSMLARRLVATTGLLTEDPRWSGLKLAPFDRMIFGGHDVRGGSLWNSAAAVQDATHSLPPAALAKVRSALNRVDKRIQPGVALNCGPAVEALSESRCMLRGNASEALAQIRKDIADFRQRERIDTLIVVNAASTEPLLPAAAFRNRAASLLSAIRRNHRDLRASEIYGAAAACEADGIINFTPNEGFLTPGVRELAEERGVVYAGNDGKTGETLVKSALAPMFRYRNLQVLSWLGYNLLGDRDGQVLADPQHKAAKVRNKDAILQGILGYAPTSLVRIDFVPSLEDNKTAWDFIHFAGFLGHRMSLQFTWAGTDSILAAPLILDMVRLAVYAHRRGEVGPMQHLAVFFKAPIAANSDDLHAQFHSLEHYLNAASKAGE